MWLGTLTLATSAVFVIGTTAVSSDAQAQGTRPARLGLSSKHHNHQTNKHGKSQQSNTAPCPEGDWDVTSITLSTTGLTFTGGAGTTVDIMSNGNAGELHGECAAGWERRLGQVQRHRDRPLRVLIQDDVALGNVPRIDGHRRCHHHGCR